MAIFEPDARYPILNHIHKIFSNPMQGLYLAKTNASVLKVLNTKSAHMRTVLDKNYRCLWAGYEWVQASERAGPKSTIRTGCTGHALRLCPNLAGSQTGDLRTL